MNGDEEINEKTEQDSRDEQPENIIRQEKGIGETSIEEGAEPSETDQDEPLTAEQLSRELEKANTKATEHWDRLIRMQADMDNLRRRTEKELQNARKFGLENIIRELLPVIDSLELGIQSAAGDSPDVIKLREGSELTLKLFLSVLKKFNCVAIDPKGEDFNPEKHQAMSMQPRADAKPNSIVEVFQKGYLLNERLVRPAMVVVAQADIAATKIDEQA